jgi:hypothetical protein
MYAVWAGTAASRRIVVSFEALLADTDREVGRLAAFIGMPERAGEPTVRAAIADHLDEALWHMRGDANDHGSTVPEAVRDLYHRLQAESAAPAGSQQPKALVAAGRAVWGGCGPRPWTGGASPGLRVGQNAVVPVKVQGLITTDRVDRLDVSLFDQISTGGTSSGDVRSLLALHAALAARGHFDYLEVGSYMGRSMQALIADPRCRKIISIDRRVAVTPDVRGCPAEYPGNTTTAMLDSLADVSGANLDKLIAIDAGTEDLSPADMSADICFIDAEHTGSAALRDARFCRRAIRDRGVIVFHDRLLVLEGIREFLRELDRYRAYPLSHDLLVVELNVPSLLSDPRVKAQVPRRTWRVIVRLGATRAALPLSLMAQTLRQVPGRVVLVIGAPRRRRRPGQPPKDPRGRLFEVHTFVNDDDLYERMRRSFIAAGFNPDGFVRLSDLSDDPYAAITRIGRESTARYPILCHQDVFADRGTGAAELTAELRRLDAIDPRWFVAGNAGITGSGRLFRRVVDWGGGATAKMAPVPVVTLDENFLVFNGRRTPRCSAALAGFHLYGSDVCLHALSDGGAAYVIDVPVTHLGKGDWHSVEYRRVRARFVEVWSERYALRYVITTCEVLFISRYRTLRRLLGSPRALAWVARVPFGSNTMSSWRHRAADSAAPSPPR